MELSHAQPINVGTTLNVQQVEDELTALWSANVNDKDDDGAVIRSRVLNLIAYIGDEEVLKTTDETVFEVALTHPCRAILLLGETEKPSKDIEAFVSSRCHLSSNGNRKHLCIEQVTMRASGDFVVELPSAALPLLVPDLTAFLWWHGELNFDNAVFKRLSTAVDRIVIDSSLMNDTKYEITKLSNLFTQRNSATVSDLNWARLTEWRSIIASLFDSHEHRPLLNHISSVEIGFSRSKNRALLIVGWLASRLDWRFIRREKDNFVFEKNGREISAMFNSVEEKNGNSSFIKLAMETENTTTFTVSLNREGSYFEVSIAGEGKPKTSTTSICKREDEACLLSAELNILHRDKSYEKAVLAVAEMFQA